MGEAKTRRAALRADNESALRLELERLMTPASLEEMELLATVKDLPFREVHRASREALDYMGMEPQQCHANAAAYESLDPTGRSKRVSGWWRRGDRFYFHSVVMTRGDLACVTPHPSSGPIHFAPDPDIGWVQVGEHMKATRGGKIVPYLVRRDSESVIVSCRAALARLDAGEEPLDIRPFPSEL